MNGPRSIGTGPLKRLVGKSNYCVQVLDTIFSPKKMNMVTMGPAPSGPWEKSRLLEAIRTQVREFLAVLIFSSMVSSSASFKPDDS